MKKRIVYASGQTATRMKLAKVKKISVYSFFPVDPWDCPCQEMLKEEKEKLSLMTPQAREEYIARKKFMTCPRDKSGMKRFKIICKNCKQIMGYAFSYNDKLDEWCDFHYTQWTDGYQWKGCFTPHISPIDGKLCIECTCGQDTRDFRANQTLPHKMVIEMEENNRRGRKFSKSSSKFLVSYG